MYHFAFISFFLSLFSTTAPLPQEQPEETVPPNIILMIGDGMGLSQMSSALYYGEVEPNYTRFPVTGLSRTSSSSHKITDSAAGATAFSCGVKTFNGAIGVNADSTALQTFLEYVATMDWKTGLVATSSITHATPASFYAHVNSRSKEFEIAQQLVNSPVHFFAGGGKQFFFNRLDGQNLYSGLEANGFAMDTTDLHPQKWDQEKRYGYLLAKNGMPRKLDGRGDFLPQATDMALEYLNQGDAPFFLMVEGSQIDWGGHANDGDYLTSEMLDFDQAIGRALDFAEKDGNTIVIVTADHECGGFALVSEEVEVPFRGKQRDYDSLRLSFTSGGHSATMVPVLAYGPGSMTFTGIYQNTAIYHKLMELTPR